MSCQHRWIVTAPIDRDDGTGPRTGGRIKLSCTDCDVVPYQATSTVVSLSELLRAAADQHTPQILEDPGPEIGAAFPVGERGHVLDSTEPIPHGHLRCLVCDLAGPADLLWSTECPGGDPEPRCPVCDLLGQPQPSDDPPDPRDPSPEIGDVFRGRLSSDVLAELQNVVRCGIMTDGDHHKQWFLAQIAELVLSPLEVPRLLADYGIGVAP